MSEEKRFAGRTRRQMQAIFPSAWATDTLFVALLDAVYAEPVQETRPDYMCYAEISSFHGRNDDEWFLLEWWGDSMGWVVSAAPVCSLYACDSGPAVEPAPRPFKRSGDPGSCGYRSGGDCASVGVSLHCKLEAGHQPLGHDYKPAPSGSHYGNTVRCGDYRRGNAGYLCGQPEDAHGTSHAMEVSTRYHLEQWAKAGK